MFTRFEKIQFVWKKNNKFSKKNQKSNLFQNPKHEHHLKRILKGIAPLYEL